MLPGDMAPPVIRVFDQGVQLPELPPRRPSRLLIGEHSKMQKRQEKTSICQNRVWWPPGWVLAGFILQLNWVLSKLVLLLHGGGRNAFCGINWQCWPPTYIWIACNFQLCICFILPFLLKIQSLLLIIYQCRYIAFKAMWLWTLG